MAFEHPPSDLPPPLQLIDMASTFMVTRALSVAAELGVFDLMADGARPVEELATATGAHGPSLRRLLRLLAAGGAVTEAEPNAFATTELGACLASEHPVSMRSLFRMINGPLLGIATEGVDYTVRTGEPADEKVLGMGLFEYLAKHPDHGAIFDAAMTDFGRQFTGAVMAAYDFSGIRRLVDVGGGHGFFLTCVLLANPAMTGAVFDQPHVIEGARQAFEEAGLSDRAEVIAGDFFESIPAGADAYSFKWIIHDWSEAEGLAILRNTRAAIAPDGKLLLLECVLPEGDEPHFGKVLDIFLMPLGGIERTEAEYADLLARAGFRLTRVVPTLSPMSVIEAVPV
ncbi:MAG: methyltransferase [Acidimicrobiales bacterium]